jgi:3'-5' exonuclease
MSYLVMDIETVPDRTMWAPAAEPVEIPKIRLKDGKPPTKGESEFLKLVMERAQKQVPVHPTDIDKAIDIATRGDTEKGGEDSDPIKLLKQIADDNLPEKKDQIAPPQAQRPIVIGCLWLGDDLSVKNLGAITALKHGYEKEKNDFNERSLLLAWSDFVARERVTIVDWNGRTFDMPVLVLRSFRHAVPLRWYFSEKDYRYRYSDDKHLDLMDTLTEYGAVRNLGFKLDIFAKAVGLPGKYGVDGSMVEGMFMEGRLSEIETYCLTDVIQTGFLFLRHLLLKGKIPISEYKKAAENLLIHIQNDPRFSDFCKLIDTNALLLTNIG